MNKELGDLGEKFSAKLLQERGFNVEHLGGNYPVVDLLVAGSSSFRVSVKTSLSKQHVRLGKEKSVSSLQNTDFVLAFLPPIGTLLDFDSNAYRTLILPGMMARNDAIHVHRSYLAKKSNTGLDRSGNAGILIKGYSRRVEQVETWKRWMEFEDRWDILPNPY